MTMQSTIRVHRHRAKMAMEGCQRLEITIGSDVVERMRNVALQKKLPLWEIIQDACEEYIRVTGNT